MKTTLGRFLPTLALTAGAAFLAACQEQARPAAQPAPPAAPAAAVSTPAAIVPPNPVAANVSPPVAEIARLHQSGLGGSVVEAFVEKSTNALSPSADEIIYLRDVGVSERVITALIQQTARMREQAAANAAAVALRTNAPAEARPNMTVIAANPNPPAPQPAPQPTAPVPAVAAAPQPAGAAPAPPVPAAQPQPASLPQSVTVFYQQLQPYGTWMQVAEHGWCWQPSVVVSTPTWRPYADRGRWLYTDCGWYWQSDYAWGWAPFHYGRWVLHARSGWLWVPDTTWGPAWVVWRSSNTHCGWAPLPPSAVFVTGRGLRVGGVQVGLNFDFGLPHHHYTFIPFNRFCDRNPHYYALAPTVAQNVFGGTTVINNIHISNNVIVNHGIAAERIASLTHSEIRRISVRDAAPQAQSALRFDKLKKSGNDLVIYRPLLNPNAPVKPVTLTNSQGESRTALVPAGALSGQTIVGRPVYDTTSTGVPVITGYTTEPPARRAGPVVIVRSSPTNAAPPPAPVISTTPAVPSSSNASSAGAPNHAGKFYGTNPNSTAAKRAGDIAPRQSAVIVPNPPDNSLFRPLTPPQPVTSTPQILTPPSPVGTSQPAARREFTRPQNSPTAPAATPLGNQPYLPHTTAPIRTSATPVQPVAPAAPRPTIVVNPPPQPSSVPTISFGSTQTKNEQEKRK